MTRTRLALTIYGLGLFAASTQAWTPPEECQIVDGKEAGGCGRSHIPAALLEDAAQRAQLRETDAETDVLHYALDLELILQYSGSTLTAVQVQGQVGIDVMSASPGLTQFTLDLLSNMSVNSVTGNVAGFTRAGDTIVVDLDQPYDAGQTFQLDVAYSGVPLGQSFGAFKWWTRNGNPIIATLSEPFYARNWWACKDSLGDKATADIHITIPNSLVAASNGTLQGIDALSGSRVKYRWHESYPIVAYLVSLAVTNYQQYNLVYNYDDGGPQTMPLNFFLYPDHWSFPLGEPAADHKAGCDEVPAMLDAFNQRFGLYPFVAEKYGMAETGGTGGLSASMEHQTITSIYRVNNFTDTVSHELAHQWWGDMVTCKTWYDIWLNEGFASYAEALYREDSGGVDAYWTRINARKPSNPDSQVYRTSIDTTAAIFSGNDVYNKGSWVLHMLRHVMGDTAFFDGLAAYRAAYQGDSADTDDFIAAASTSFGHDLSFFTEQWVKSPGSPRVQWNYTTRSVGGQTYLVLSVVQTQESNGYGLFTMPIDVRVTTPAGPTVTRIWNDDETEYYVFPVTAAPTLVEFDEDGGVNDRQWVLFASRTKVTGTVAAPPVIVQLDTDWFGNSQPGESVVTVVFSEDVGSLDAADIGLTGAATGAWPAASVAYNAANRTGTIRYQSLPADDYTLTVFSAAILANGKKLDGEISDADWWDSQLLPSGEGQPGGDAVVNAAKRFDDSDADGDVDQFDFEALFGCVSPPGGAFVPACDVFDHDFDGDVDLIDVGRFLVSFTSMGLSR